MTTRCGFPDNEIDGFRMGGNFDLRVRVAVEMLQHGTIPHVVHLSAGEMGKFAAEYALSAATHLIDLAVEQGLAKPWDSDEIGKFLKKHAKRVVAWQVEQQLAGQRAQQDMAGRVMTAAPGILAGAKVN